MSNRIEQEHDIASGGSIRFTAEHIRKERTGIHATVSIIRGVHRLAWSHFNVERDEDRVRLANSGHKHLDEIAAVSFTKERMQLTLSGFCAGLWEAQIGLIDAGPMDAVRRVAGPSFAIRPYVIEGGGTIVYAPPGRGKSFTALLMAVSTDAGCPGLFADVGQVPSLYINIERSKASMSDRLSRVNLALGLDEGRPLHFLNARGQSLHDVADAARRLIDRAGIGVVYLDSISRSGMGDLNDNQAANKIIDVLNDLVPTWVSLAHTPRADETHTYGSVHFDAGIDIGIKLATQKEDTAIGCALTVTKANDGPSGGKPFIYVLEFDDTGLSGVRRPRKGEFAVLEGSPAQSVEVRIQRFLLDVGRATGTQISEELGIERTNIVRALSGASWAVKAREGREVYYSVRYAPEGTP